MPLCACTDLSGLINACTPFWLNARSPRTTMNQRLESNWFWLSNTAKFSVSSSGTLKAVHWSFFQMTFCCQLWGCNNFKCRTLCSDYLYEMLCVTIRLLKACHLFICIHILFVEYCCFPLNIPRLCHFRGFILLITLWNALCNESISSCCLCGLDVLMIWDNPND